MFIPAVFIERSLFTNNTYYLLLATHLKQCSIAPGSEIKASVTR